MIEKLWNFFRYKGADSKGRYRRVWAIGDIQGCYDSFKELLQEIDFDATKDQLWIAGDLVNRGDKSLETLEYLYSIRDSVKVVLGNHDITLLAIYWGIRKSNPTLDPILNSPNRDMLLEWLRLQPFVHYDKEIGYVMAHAGIPPAFDLDMALRYNHILQQKLQSQQAPKWLKKMMKGKVDSFYLYDSKKKHERYAINGFTRMRFCDIYGRLDFMQKGSPTKSTYSKALFPWFEVKPRKILNAKVVFGHWSTLGFVDNDAVVSLDTGCVWHGKMTAKRIDTDESIIVQVDCF